MRILAIYNTRGMVGPLEALRTRHLEHCDLFVHCGNSLLPYTNEYISGYVVIRGIDDFDAHFLRDFIIDIYDKKILIINNFEFRGKKGLQRLHKFVLSLQEKISVVICATTDMYAVQQIQGILYVSPGDANENSIHTYAVIDSSDEEYMINFFDITTSQLKYSKVFKIEKGGDGNE